MKRNWLALFAVATAIALSSFSGIRISYLYLKYVGGPENSINSYSPIGTSQASPTFDHVFTTPIPTLNWLRIVDQDNDGVVDTQEWAHAINGFPQYDTDSDGLLKDEAADITGKLDLKNK